MTQERRKLDAHNKRVRAFADRMPPGILANAIRAIGYAADWQTGRTSGFTKEKLADLSRERFDGKFSISRASLTDALDILRENGVITVTGGKEQAEDGTWQNRRSDYRINFDTWQGDTGKLRSDLMGKRQRRRNRIRANIPPDGATSPAAQSDENSSVSAPDDEAERIASLTQWDDGPPPDHDPWTCGKRWEDCPECQRIQPSGGKR